MSAEEMLDRLDRMANNYKYHKPDGSRVVAHEGVREECRILALYLHTHCPPSRELSVAQTKLEEVMFWANAAIARN